jgi:hypothetical protein
LIHIGTNRVYIRRNERGRFFAEVMDVARSLSTGQRVHVKTAAEPDDGDARRDFRFQGQSGHFERSVF